MKLRTIIVILSLLAFLSTATGGYLYFKASKKISIQKIETHGEWHAEMIRDRLENQIVTNLRALRGLSGHKEIKQILNVHNKSDLDDVNQILDNFNTAFEANVSYLMDRNGNTIASSNRNDSDSFVGKNYAFRPYFQNAIQRTTSIYMALGVTSGKRGIYYSHEVYSDDKDSPSGVVVMKVSADTMEKELLDLRRHFQGMLTFITSPIGVIFMSDTKAYLFQLMDKISDETISAIVESKQFGNKRLKWSGFGQKGPDRIIDKSGNQYIIIRKSIASLPDWHVVHLNNVKEISKDIYAPLVGNFGYIIFALCILVGLSVAILNRIAQADITRRKTAESALQESEQRFRAIFDDANDGILLGDAVTKRFVMANNVICRMLGYSKEEILNLSVFDIHPKEELHFVLEAFERQVKEEIRIVENLPVKRKDGTLFYADINSAPISIGSENCLVGIFRDITERKKAEDKLKQNEQRYKSAQRMGKVGNWEFDLLTGMFWGSDEAKRIYGFDAESKDFTADEVERSIPERERVHQALLDLIEKGKPYDLEFVIHPISGQAEKSINSIAEVVKNDSGMPTKVVGVIQDITARKLADERIRKSEEKYRILFESSKDANYISTMDGHIIEANRSFLDLFGYKLEELHDLRTQDLYINPADRSLFLKEVEKHGFVRDFEEKLQNKNGIVMDCKITATLRRSLGGNIKGYQGIIRDVTENKKKQIEREKLISELQDALAEIKTLSGLLPICSYCKKIRDDKGYWNQIEGYIQEHSDAEFSHSICRECAKKHYPDMDIYDD